MGMEQLTIKLSENLAELNTMFGASADYYAKQISICGCPAAILLFDGMASLSSLWTVLLDAVNREDQFTDFEQDPPPGQRIYDHLMHHSDLPAESVPVRSLDDVVMRLTAGFAVLLLDGCSRGIAFSVQSLKFRSIGEPSGEGNLRGSREGFSDLLRVNLSLLRRLIRNDALVMEVSRPIQT